MSAAIGRSEVETLVRQVTLEYFARTNVKIAPTLDGPRLGPAHARQPRGSRRAVRARPRTDRRPAAVSGRQFRRERNGDAGGPAQPPDFEPADSRSDAQAARRWSWRSPTPSAWASTSPSGSRATSRARRGAFIMGPRGVIEAERGRDPGRHPRPHESRRGRALRREAGRPDEVARGRRAGITFNRVHVRIDQRSRLNVHMDTDEANACGLHLAKEIELTK